MVKTGEIAEGARVRVTERSVSGDVEIDRSAGRPGSEYDVTYFAGPGEGDSEHDDRAYYLLDEQGSFGGSHWAYPEHVEVVMTPQQMAARKPPSPELLREGVASALMGMHDPIDIDEADYVNGGEVTVCGTTDDGLRVSFRVRIDRVEEVDW